MADDYDSMEDALFDALEAVKGVDGNKLEWTSVVYRKPNGKIGFSAPMGGKKEGSFSEKIRIPKGATLLSLAHNHPQDKDDHHFSNADIEMAERMKIPTAIAYGPSVDASIFTPGKSQVQKMPFGRTYSLGESFTHIPEVKPAGTRLGPPQQTALIQALRGE